MEETNNIIGDFLNINSDIIGIEYTEKNKLLAKIKTRYYKNQLIKKAKRLYNSNVPLTRNNILELANYVYANYLPNGKFKDIAGISYFSSSNSYIMNINNIANVSYNIKISLSNDKFTLYILAPARKENKGYTIELESLYSNNREIATYIDNLNKVLLHTIADYILEAIE